jgi:glutamate N-acetyltransferase/amino-acid N-acetyltransferase
MESQFTKIKGGVGAPQGFLTAAISCGIKNPDATRLDLALIHSEVPCASAGTFTTNRVKAAPVKLSQAHLRKGDLRCIIANSGNANACTGVVGIRDAKAMCSGVAKALNLKTSEVGVCSTGVIGLPMPMVRIENRIPELVEKLSPRSCADVAAAIITSDTHAKEVAISFDIDGHTVKMGGCVKGAGMISPSMASMLCLITTVANLSSD